MQLQAAFMSLPDVHAEWLVVGVWEDRAPAETLGELDQRLGHLLTRLRDKGDVEGKALELTPILSPANIAAERLLLVGLGKRDEATRADLTDAAAAATRSLTGKKRGHLAIALPEGVPNLSAEDVAVAI